MNKNGVFNVSINGIKCDNCGWKNMSIPYSEYRNYLNRSCSICGENLLTKKDYKTCKRIIFFSKIVNKLFKPKNESSCISIKGNFNGSGKVLMPSTSEGKAKKVILKNEIKEYISENILEMIVTLLSICFLFLFVMFLITL